MILSFFFGLFIHSINIGFCVNRTKKFFFLLRFTACFFSDHRLSQFFFARQREKKSSNETSWQWMETFLIFLNIKFFFLSFFLSNRFSSFFFLYWSRVEWSGIDGEWEGGVEKNFSEFFFLQMLAIFFITTATWSHVHNDDNEQMKKLFLLIINQWTEEF